MYFKTGYRVPTDQFIDLHSKTKRRTDSFGIVRYTSYHTALRQGDCALQPEASQARQWIAFINASKGQFVSVKFAAIRSNCPRPARRDTGGRWRVGLLASSFSQEPRFFAVASTVLIFSNERLTLLKFDRELSSLGH